MDPSSTNNSKCTCCGLWNNTKVGISVSILINLNYLIIWHKDIPLLTYFSYLALFFIIGAFLYFKFNYAEIPYSYSNKYEYITRETIEECIKVVALKSDSLRRIIDRVASFNNISFQIEIIIGAYVFIVLTSILSQKLLILLVINICLFYPLIEQKYPNAICDCFNKYSQLLEEKVRNVQSKIPKYKESQ